MKIEVRPEESGDSDAIRSLVTRAFRSQNEPLLVDRLRGAGAVALSLVAVVDGKIAGHILFSPMTMNPDLFGAAIYGLAPLAVAPEYQKQGIGRELIRLTRIAIGEQTMLLLLSAPNAMDYYPKLGFEKVENGYIIHRKK